MEQKLFLYVGRFLLVHFFLFLLHVFNHMKQFWIVKKFFLIHIWIQSLLDSLTETFYILFKYFELIGIYAWNSSK